MRGRRWTGLLAVVLAVLALGATACEPNTNPPTAPGTKRIQVFGDSIPSWLIANGSAGIDTTRFTVVDGSVSACDGSLPFYDARWGTDQIVPVTDWCKKGWRKHYPPFLQTRPDVAVVMGGVHAMLDHKISGVWQHPCSTTARHWYYEDIKARLNYLKAYADRVILVLPAWPGPMSRWIMPADYVARATCVRDVMTSAAAVRNVATIDFGAYLCPTSPTVCTPARDQNGIHIDVPDAAPTLAWLLARIDELDA